MNKNMLIIPGGFVPFNDTVTLISYKHLRNCDMDMDVVALKGKDDPEFVKCLKKDDNFRKFHIDYVCNYDDAIATFERKNVLSGVWNLFKYCRFAKKKAKNKEYSVVYTSSVPAFTHLAGFWIKKMLGDKIIWIASITDPLYKSPYKYDDESFKEYSIIGKIGFYVYIWIYMNGYYEKICQKYADKVVYICDEERDFIISHYKNKESLLKKSMVVPLNYIEEWDMYKTIMNCPVPVIQHDGPKVVSHFGRVYGLRKINQLLEALNELNKEIDHLEDHIVFEQYGQILDRYKTLIKQYNLEKVFKYHDKVSYDEVIKKMKESDCLALFDTFVDTGMQPYLPSKMVDYLLMHKDLFVLTPNNSPSHRLFSSYGYKCTDNDVSEIKTRLKEIIFGSSYVPVYDISNLENKNAVKELIEYINSVSNK